MTHTKNVCNKIHSGANEALHPKSIYNKSNNKEKTQTTYFLFYFSNERKKNVSQIKFSNKEMLIFSSRLSLVFAKHTLV